MGHEYLIEKDCGYWTYSSTASIKIVWGIVSLPHLAALIWLADELDMAADRNPAFLYDPMRLNTDHARLEFLRQQCIESVEIGPDSVRIKAVSDDPRICECIVGGAVSKRQRFCTMAVWWCLNGHRSRSDSRSFWT